MNNTVSLLIVIIGFVLFDRIVRHNPDKKPKANRDRIIRLK